MGDTCKKRVPKVWQLSLVYVLIHYVKCNLSSSISYTRLSQKSLTDPISLDGACMLSLLASLLSPD